MFVKVLKYLLYLSPILGIIFSDEVIIRFIVKMIQLNIIANNKENLEFFSKLYENRGMIDIIFAILSWNLFFSFVYLANQKKILKANTISER